MTSHIQMLLAPLVAASLVACGSGSTGTALGDMPKNPEKKPWEQPAPRPTCGPDDRVEPALSGQVPLSERVSNRSATGYNCNLAPVGLYVGEGTAVAHAWYGNCAYYDTTTQSYPWNIRDNEGLVVVDVSDSAHPHATTMLETPAISAPLESLRVNERRGLLAAMHGVIPRGTKELDVYDLTEDCAHPKLLFSGTIGGPDTATGHEGNWTPDGRTYWGSSTDEYFAIDMTNPADPKYMQSWTPEATTSAPVFVGPTHGLSVSKDGKRTYFTRPNPNGASLGEATNGFVIADTSEIQDRLPGAQVRVISTVGWADSGEAQHTIPVTIAGKPYLIIANEYGAGGQGQNAWAWACANNLPPFGYVRIYNISDERNPTLASKVMLEVNDPAHCAETLADNVANTNFGYDNHYCNVDDLDDTKILACSWFSSGLRVFDISDPYRPKEYGYYIPPFTPGTPPGSFNNFNGICSGTNWVASQPRIRRDRNEIWFTSMCGGFHVARFTKPLP